MRIGVISDTHGLLHPGVAGAFAGVARIVHAGDVGGATIVAELEAIAPVTAVRGNTDGLELGLRDEARLELDGVTLLAVHARHWLRGRDLVAEGVDVVVSGHTHVAGVERAGGVLFVNPGSVTHPRGGSAVSVAVLTVDHGKATASIVELD